MQLCEWMIRECDKRSFALKIKMEKRRILSSLIFFVHILLVSIDFVNCGIIHLVGEKEYQVLLLLAAGNFVTSKRERSNVEKAAVVKFWRSKRPFTTDENGKVLLFDNKRVST